MKIKIQKRKYIRNIIIGVVALIIVAFIINIAPGYKRNKYKDVTNLVIGDENVTEKLQKPIYKDEEGNIYIAKEDVKELLDKTLYYDEENSMVIATSEVVVASMKLNEKIINIDGTNKDTLETIINKDNIIYIPIEEMESVYNIEVNYLEEENIVIIDKLNEGMIKAEAAEEADIRFKQRGLSKKVGELEVGDVVSAFYTPSKGWRLIRTEDGKIGYVKANVLTNEYIVRQDMEQDTQTKRISVSIEDGTTLDIEGKKVLIKDLLKLTEEGLLLKNTEFTGSDETTEVWANLTIEEINLDDFEQRKTVTKNIASMARKNEIKGINIIINSDENLERFVIELAPKLKEVGIITNIVEEGSINEEVYTDIVNYIITK